MVRTKTRLSSFPSPEPTSDVFSSRYKRKIRNKTELPLPVSLCWPVNQACYTQFASHVFLFRGSIYHSSCTVDFILGQLAWNLQFIILTHLIYHPSQVISPKALEVSKSLFLLFIRFVLCFVLFFSSLCKQQLPVAFYFCNIHWFPEVHIFPQYYL